MNSSLLSQVLETLLDNANTSESLYASLGSSWPIDTAYVYVLAPIGFTGIICNLCTCFVKLNAMLAATRSNKSPPSSAPTAGSNVKMLRLLQVYTMNSLLICLLTGLCVVSYAPRYTSAAFFYLARLHRCFGVAYVFRVLYMLSKVIETLLLLDRLAMFTPRFRLVSDLRTWQTVPSVLAFSVLVNLPFFVFRGQKSDAQFAQDLLAWSGANETTRATAIRFCAVDADEMASMFQIVVFVITHLCELVAEVVAGTLLVVHFRSYLAKHSRLSHQPNASVSNGQRKRSDASLRRTTTNIAYFTVFSLVFNLGYMMLYVCFYTRPTEGNLESSLVISQLVLVCFKEHVRVTFFCFLDKNFKKTMRKMCQVFVDKCCARSRRSGPRVNIETNKKE